MIKIEDDNFLNSIDDYKVSKRIASERNLKSAYPNTKNNYYYSGLAYNNQTIQNSSIQALNSTQQAQNTNVINVNQFFYLAAKIFK